MNIGIVGAGPAGAHLAAELARDGWAVTLYDHKAPWEKPCGGGAPFRAAAVIGLFRELPRCEVDSAILEGPTGELAEVQMDEPLVVFSRTDLFRHMLRRATEAGAIHEARKVVGVRRTEDGGAEVEIEDGDRRHHSLVVG